MHHRRGLRRLTGSDAVADRIEQDPESEAWSPGHRAMLRYALALTRSPGQVGAADVQALRDTGYGDAAILAIAEVTAYYAYVNRIADGLGVELEERHRA